MKDSRRTRHFSVMALAAAALVAALPLLAQEAAKPAEGCGPVAKWAGSELFSRKLTGYGMYIVTGKPSHDNICSSWFFGEPLPSPDWYPQAAKVARWREMDWEFVPGNTCSNAMEKIELTGVPPSLTAAISMHKADGWVPGAYVDDLYATWSQTNRPQGKCDSFPSVSTFQELVNQTKICPDDEVIHRCNAGGDQARFIVWASADSTSTTDLYTIKFKAEFDTHFPGTAPYTFLWDFSDGTTSTDQNPTHTFATTRDVYPINLTVKDSASHTVTVNGLEVWTGSRRKSGTHWTAANRDWNFYPADRASADLWTKGWTMSVWRMPTGTMSVGVNDAAKHPVTAIPTTLTNLGTSDSKFCVKQTPVAGFTDGSFNPYDAYATYTFVWTPDRVAFYLNLPEGGKKIDKAAPVWEVAKADFPSIGVMGKGIPLATQSYLNYGDETVADYRLILQAWVSGDGWSGPDPLTYTFPDTVPTVLVQRASYFPLTDGKEGTVEADFTLTGDAVIDDDFTDTAVWTAQTWKGNLQKNWINKFSGEEPGKENFPDLVEWVANDGISSKPALKLKVIKADDVAKPAFLRLTHGGYGPGDMAQYCLVEVTGTNTYAKYTPGATLGEAVLYAAENDILTVTVINNAKRDCKDKKGQPLTGTATLKVLKGTDTPLTWQAVTDPDHLLTMPNIPNKIVVNPWKCPNAESAGCVGGADGDTGPDLVWQEAGSGRVVYAEAGDPAAQPVEFQGVSLASGETLLGGAQLDGKGHVDLITSIANNPEKVRALFIKDGALQGRKGLKLKKGTAFRLACDADHDTKAELVCQSQDASGTVWIGSLNKKFEVQGWASLFAAEDWTVVGAGDMDGDTHRDLVLQKGTRVQVARLAWADGIPTLAGYSEPIEVGEGRILGAADHDTDGWKDLYVARPDGMVEVVTMTGVVTARLEECRELGSGDVVVLPQ